MARKASPKPGVGTIVTAALKQGKSNEEVLDEVKKKLPDQHTTIASVAWYRNKARQTNKSIPTARALKKKRAKTKTAPSNGHNGHKKS